MKIARLTTDLRLVKVNCLSYCFKSSFLGRMEGRLQISRRMGAYGDVFFLRPEG